MPASTRQPTRSSQPWRWLALALCVTACSAVNVWRAAYWKTQGVAVLRDFDRVADPATGQPAHWARSYGRIEVLNQRWRPVRLTLRLRAAATAPSDGTPIQILADYKPIASVRLSPHWSTHTFIVASPEAADGALSLQLEAGSLPAAGSYGFGFDGLASEPVLAPKPIVRHALIGAGFGLLLWLVCSPSRWPWRREAAVDAQGSSGEPDLSAEGRRRTIVYVAAGLFVYFAGWALIRPPLQTGDERQHLARATSVLLHPWVADPGRFAIDPRFVNPLVEWEPTGTSKLPFDPAARITAAELGEIEAIDWRPRDRIPPLDPWEKAIASYPTLYYLALFAIAQPVTTVLDMSPYQSTYVYRLVTCAFTAILWALVWGSLAKTHETRALRWPLLLLLVCNPMLAYLSSGVTVDSVSNPLSALALLACWRTLIRNESRGAAFAWLVAGALVKPAALQVIAAVAAGAGLAWLLDRRLHLRSVLIVLTQAGLVAMGGFYAWSTPRFLGEGPSYDSLRQYVARRAAETLKIWIEYWGRLGWLDYQVETVWYVLLFAVVALNLACLWQWPRQASATMRSFAVFAAGTIAAFVGATLVGEFLYLPQAGYTLQGRYFLPVGLLVAALAIWHEVRAARTVLVGCAIMLTVLLAQRTVTRYYEDGWKGVRDGLPLASRAGAAAS